MSVVASPRLPERTCERCGIRLSGTEAGLCPACFIAAMMQEPPVIPRPGEVAPEASREEGKRSGAGLPRRSDDPRPGAAV